MRVVGQARRFTAGRGHGENLRVHVGEGAVVAVHQAGEHDGRAVRRPFPADALTAVAIRAAEAGRGGQLGAGQEVARDRASLGFLHNQVRALVVEPRHPDARREGLIGAGVIFAVLGLLGRFLVGLVVHGAGINRTREQQLATVRAPLGRAGPGGQGRDALRFATRGEIKHVDLGSLVGVALGREGELPAVRRPGRAALAGLAKGDAARRRVVRQRLEPEVGGDILGVVGRIGDGIDDPLPIGAGHGRGEAFHEPHILVGDGFLGGRLGGPGRAGQNGQQRQQGKEQTGHLHRGKG